MTTTQFNNNIDRFHIVLNAYTEATQNNIIALQDKYLTPIATHGQSDFSTITGVKIAGATNLANGLITDNDMTASSCKNICADNAGCNGALYTKSPKSCQLYSSIPLTSAYTYDNGSAFISYEHYMTPEYRGVKGATGTVNAKIMDALETELKIISNVLPEQMSSNYQTDWNNAITKLGSAKTYNVDFENEKKINQDIKAQLHNSSLNVIQTKSKYILFIALLLILLAVYIRDFNFSITVFIILFLMISVYGSIFLGAFLLVLIVLYLVYYAY